LMIRKIWKTLSAFTEACQPQAPYANLANFPLANTLFWKLNCMFLRSTANQVHPIPRAVAEWASGSPGENKPVFGWSLSPFLRSALPPNKLGPFSIRPIHHRRGLKYVRKMNVIAEQWILDRDFYIFIINTVESYFTG
jgi:hypothetical protein